jgi:membrane protein implicated in regulation of membrane protease activity
MQISPIHLLAAGAGLLVLEFLLPGFGALWYGCAALSLAYTIRAWPEQAARQRDETDSGARQDGEPRPDK